jgi:hypothetical protein
MYFGRVGGGGENIGCILYNNPWRERNGRREVGERELEGRDQNLARKRAKQRD